MPGSNAKLARIMATSNTLVTQTPRNLNQLIFGLSAGMTDDGGALAFCLLDKAIVCLELECILCMNSLDPGHEYIKWT